VITGQAGLDVCSSKNSPPPLGLSGVGKVFMYCVQRGGGVHLTLERNGGGGSLFPPHPRLCGTGFCSGDFGLAQWLVVWEVWGELVAFIGR